jgi:hypothetical protein
MRANDLFIIEINLDGDDVIAHGRVLYWWEEQEIKSNAIHEDQDNKLTYDQSKIYGQIVNKFLLSMESGEKKMTQKDLIKKSLESGVEVHWTDILHFSSIVPLYNAYLEVSESSSDKIKNFRRKILAVYDPSLRTDSIDDYPLPPEAIEFNLMKYNGTLTREDLYKMSYCEILRYQIIKEIDSKHIAQKTQEQPSSNGIPDGTYGLDPNFTNAHDMAKKHFPDVVIS